MTTFAPAALFALFLWWFSTGVLLYVDHLPRTTYSRSLLTTTLLAVLASAGVYLSSAQDTLLNAYLAFVCALMIWAWHELTFLMGIVTGPRKTPCPRDATGWRRFWYATATVIHHELALAATALVLVAATWDAPNQVGTQTFLALWVMRLSAKFNVFLGVRNLTTEFVPIHMTYMLSYFRQAKFNPLMPISLGLGAVAVTWLLTGAFSPAATPFSSAAIGLVATTVALGVVEHVFLAIPVPDAVLWRWAQDSAQVTQKDFPASDGDPTSAPPAPAHTRA